ncbi:MAG: hypothetical protein JRN37_06525 [Nitrososphaerota archaeon]|jgi:hypothetical protein|nr:hypothetical protein [Nitrososphaerota archaeon]MDG7038791.1 hypothetical protein [Nitrososphaerota archaeon]
MTIHCKHCGYEIELISDVENGMLYWVHKESQWIQCKWEDDGNDAEPSDNDNVRVIKRLIKVVNNLTEEIRGLSK